MKQKLLAILICLWGISNINAQFNTLSVKEFSASPVKTDGQFRAATADGALYFGYCDDNITQAVGMGQPATLSAAICMPTSISGAYAGKTITKIRIGLWENCTSVSVWIRNSLTGAVVASQMIGSASKGWTEATLSTPFTIPSNEFYIGYTATGSAYQIGFSGSDAYDGCWLWDSADGWINTYGSGWGSMCIQALIDTQGATVLALSPQSLTNTVQGSPNQSLSVQAAVTNYSSVDVTSVKAVYQINNQAAVEQTITTSITTMKTGTFIIPINAIAAKGIYQLSVKITEVNGQANYFANTVLNSEIRILTQPFSRKVVMEEGTGAWCGWCPRGAVGMAMMKEKYPDTFIGIAVHDKTNGPDPMAVTEYDNFIVSFISGFPGAVIDRKTYLECNPYPDYGAEYCYQYEISQTPLAGIKLTGGFTDANKTAITLKAVTTFGLTIDNANFKLVYVLIENGVTGYTQANFYSGGSSGAMGGYESKPNPITDMVFNDVARGIYSAPTGIAGSIPASVTEMTPIEHTYTINLSNVSIQNKNQLEVVVMLLNATTGEIENADKIEISGVYDPTGIVGTKTVAANVYESAGNLYIESGVSETFSIYTASGVKIYQSEKTPGATSVSCDRFPKGLLIVKGNSGWVKKVENH